MILEIFFIQVREATSEIADVWINLAHVHQIQGQYEKAILLYNKCMEHFVLSDEKVIEILKFLSKAYFEYGKLEDCVVYIQRIIHIEPWNLDWWYNLALTYKESADKHSNSKDPTFETIEKSKK